MATDQDQRAIAAIALLADQLRQRLYRSVVAQPGPVTRDQAATALRISRKLAAFHLDKLLSAGLLEAITPDPASRRPGPGRAPKAYRPAAAAELTVSIPSAATTCSATCWSRRSWPRGRPAAPGWPPTSSPGTAARRWASASGPSGGLAGSAPSAP